MPPRRIEKDIEKLGLLRDGPRKDAESALRKALGDPDLVATTNAGYCLCVEPDELDADRFAREVDEGRTALGAGRPERAGTILREALSLWRGPPLADMAFEPFAQAEIARLEE